MHNIKQICSGSQCVSCGQKSVVITRWEDDGTELTGRTDITEHRPFCIKFRGPGSTNLFNFTEGDSSDVEDLVNDQEMFSGSDGADDGSNAVQDANSGIQNEEEHKTAEEEDVQNNGSDNND